MPSSLTTILALVVSARAFAPEPGAGIEPQRLVVQHGETQGRLLQTPAWKRFVATDGVGWTARFDETTRVPRWMWGQGIPMYQDGMSRDELLGRLQTLLERHSDLLGFDAGTLSGGSAKYNAKFDTWYVEFTPLRDGTPTYRGTISARIKHGNLILLTVRTAPDAPVAGTWALSGAAAITQAIAQGPAPGAIHTEPTAVPQLLERQDLAGLHLERTWMVRTRTQDPPGIWVSFVDAATGELLNVHNEVRFVAGTVTGDHHERTVDGQPLINDPMPLVVVDGTSDSDIASETGDYSVTDSNTYTTDLNGDYLDVNNTAGQDGVLSDNNPDLVWTTADATQAEIDTYVFGNQIRVWGERVEPTVGIVRGPLNANVNLNDVCNAYYDGAINFFAAGSGCNNTGQIADVVYHEWGHGFHGDSILSGVFDGSLSEGAGDTTSFIQTHDHLMAPFFIQGGGAIRNVEPNRVYPDDMVGEVHEEGLIFAGAMWDTWGFLDNSLGTVDGKETIEQIFAGLLKGGPTIADSYFEAITADDDDGNLANGTPNQCDILQGFGLHGLGELLGGGAFITNHEPLVFEPAGVVTQVEVELQPAAPQCSPEVASGTVHWRVDGGNWEAAAGSVAGQIVTGEIPSLPLGSFVEYWIDGDDSDGNGWQTPGSGEFAPFSFFVGDVIEIACEDFEASDGGYQHELVDGVPEDGADDWMWGAPNGVAGDPAAAYSGNNAWGNNLGPDGYNGEYKAEKFNRLWSPPVDTLWYTDVFLQYRRWLTVEDGIYDHAVITANGSEVWSNHASNGGPDDEHHQDQQWVSHAVDLQNIADQTKVELGWELHSDQALEFGGWNIDDVCVYAPQTTDNKMAIVDLVVEDQGGPIGLSWTNPIYTPLDEIRVLRRTDQYPTSFDDTSAELIFKMLAPVVGEHVEKVHGNLDGSAGYYSVYGFDGTDWLSWTIEGWNAGHADANSGGTIGDPVTTDGAIEDTAVGGDEFPDEDGDGVPDGKGGGCGCSSSAPTGSLAVWTLVGALALIRRRSRG